MIIRGMWRESGVRLSPTSRYLNRYLSRYLSILYCLFRPAFSSRLSGSAVFSVGMMHQHLSQLSSILCQDALSCAVSV